MLPGISAPSFINYLKKRITNLPTAERMEYTFMCPGYRVAERSEGYLGCLAGYKLSLEYELFIFGS